MITPAEIQSKQFTKSVMGYKCEEVDIFLDMITLDLEKVLKENDELKKQLEETQDRSESEKQTVSATEETMRQAQDMMRDIAESAEKRADLIIRNAEIEAESRIRGAKERAVRLEEENRSLARSVEEFRERYRRMLEAELEKLGPGHDTRAEDIPAPVTRLEEILGETDEPFSFDDSDMRFGDQDPGAGEDDGRKTIVMKPGDKL